MTTLPLPPLKRKNWLPVKGSKNKLMQAFQELDKMTHAETSADYWKSPSPLHLCSHFIVLTSQVPDNCMLSYWVNISVLCVARSNHHNSSSSRRKRVLEQLINTSPSLSHTHPGDWRNFSDIFQRSWVVKLGCQGDKKDVAVTTVQ